MKKFIEMLQKKLEVTKQDADYTFFHALLEVGEALTKIVTLIIVSAIQEDEERQQYKILHGLVRANGIGDWSKAIDDALGEKQLLSEFSLYRSEFNTKAMAGEWQADAVSLILEALKEFHSVDNQNQNQNKRYLKDWFKVFTELRNKTRGHGATTSVADKVSRASVALEKSIQILLSNLSIFEIQCAYIHKSLSGRYRVTGISNNYNDFSILSSDNDVFLPEDGVYVYIGGFKKLPLISSSSTLSDFYLANGGFNEKKFEMLSYFSDNKIEGNSENYLFPLGILPKSESAGLLNLDGDGDCFNNLPKLSFVYVDRKKREETLFESLMDRERKPIITLHGRGGIGKTSLALKVIPDIYDKERFDAVFWFSARDIDLQVNGPKNVRPDVLTNKDVSKYFASLVLSEKNWKDRSFNALKFFQESLTESGFGRHKACLFVFDNFETIDNQSEMFLWIETFARLPNKVLITTRHSDFNGDYKIDVPGMEIDEVKKLIFSISSASLPDSTIREIYTVSSGHPYVIKMLIGDYQKNKKIKKILAGKDKVLSALFERTYLALSYCSQRIFMMLSVGNSIVPRLALEAVVMESIDNPTDVEDSIDQLLSYSMIDRFFLKENKEKEGEYIGLPYVAKEFGLKKLNIDPSQAEILNDVKKLKKFGSAKPEDKNLSFDKSFFTFLGELHSKKDFDDHKNILESICLTFNYGLFLTSEWLIDFASNDKKLLTQAKAYLTSYH
jgi:hypothetical protein